MKILSVDVGGTFIKYALMNESSEFIERGSYRTPLTGRQDFADSIIALYEKYPEAEGLAISLNGIVDTRNGHCLMGGSLPYNTDFYLKDALSEKIPLRISIENDANCAAMAEASVGSLADVEDGLVIILGTMIGGGIVHNHRLLHGKHFSAGEVSYVMPRSDLPMTGEGVFGNVSSAAGLCRLYAQKKGLPENQVDGRMVFARFDAGEKEATETLDEFTRGLAVQLFNFQTVLDVEKIAIGGGISAQDSLLDLVRGHLDRLYESCPYCIPHAEIVRCRFGNDANLIGALQCWLAEMN